MQASAAPRRVPVRLAPADGESLRSWLLRFADRLELPPGVVADWVGLSAREDPAAAVSAWRGVRLTGPVRAAVSAATGLDRRRVDQMLLAVYDGTALDLTGFDPSAPASLRAVALREWALFQGTRVCPRCLAEDGVRRLWWRLSLAAVCPIHHCLLLDVCPDCGLPVDSGNARGSAGLSRVAVADPRTCAARTRRGVCPAMLSQAATPQAAGLVAVQQKILAAAAGRPLPVGGVQLTAAGWFLTVRNLAGIVRYCATPTDVVAAPDACRAAFAELAGARDRAERGTANRAWPSYLTAPANAPLAGYLIAAITPALEADSHSALEDALMPLAADYERMRSRRPGGFLPATLPHPAGGIWRRHTSGGRTFTELARPHALARRTGQCRPSPDPSASDDVRFVPDKIPEGMYNIHVVSYLPCTAMATGCRFASLAAARLTGASSWPDAARQLGLDPARAARTCDVVSRRITDPVGFWEAIAELTRILVDGPQPIDYRRRRRVLAAVTMLPPPVWDEVASEHQLVMTATRRRNAAAWLWEQWAGGDYRESPAMRAAATVKPASARELFRRFSNDLSPLLGSGLLAWADRQLTGPAGEAA